MPANTIAQPKSQSSKPTKSESAPAPVSESKGGPIPPLADRPSANEEIEAAFSGTDPVSKPDIVKAKESPKPQQEGSDQPKTEGSEAPKVDDAEEHVPGDEFLIDDPKEEPKKEEKQEPQKQAQTLPDGEPLKAPELRAAYRNLKTKVATLEKQLEESKAKPLEDSERKSFTEQIVTLNKKLEEATANLKTVAYEQSDEFKSRYEEPFMDTWNEGVQQVETLTVTLPDGATRKGTPNDFQVVMRESDNERAAEIASELFGTNAFYLLATRRELQKLNSARNKALNEYKTTLGERTKSEIEAAKKQKEQQEADRVQRITLFKKFNEEAAQKFPDLFAPLEGDDEGNKILDKGFKNADLAFSGGNGLTSEQVVRLHSAIRNRAGAFGRLVHRLKQRDAKIEELEKVISELRGSTPGEGQVGRGEKTSKELTFEEELEQVAKKRSS